MNKQISIKELKETVDFLVISSSGLTLYIQDYLEDEIIIEYDDGSYFASFPPNQQFEVLGNKCVLIDDLEMIGFVSTQVTF